MILREYLKEKTELLAASAIPDAENEAWVILLTCTSRSRAELRFLLPEPVEKALSPSELSQLEAVFSRRAKREPLAYIVGHAPFYDMEFSVGKGVLIPRFDTEILVESALAGLGLDAVSPGLSSDIPKISSWTPDMDRPVVIFDLCTGSGIIGITLASILKKRNIQCKVVMTEISEEAAAYAKKNVKDLLSDPEEMVKVEIADLWPSEDPEKADLIVTNPPYISEEEMQVLLPEVREFEPSLALTDEGDGLTMYRRILSDAGQYLYAGGGLFMEHGCDQAGALKDLMCGKWESITCVQDYGHRDRVTCGIYRGEA